MSTIMKTKLVLKDIGNPVAVTLLADGTQELLLGTLIGIANKRIERKSADGLTTYPGLGGTFEGKPADASKDTVRSGICFLPDAWQGPILDALAGDDENEPAQSVRFAYGVYAVKANNPAKYSWAVKPLVEMTAETDPLEDFRQSIPSMSVPKLEVPKEGKK